MKYKTPDYKRIYIDILNIEYPHKQEECKNILKKRVLTTIDIIELNQKIFGVNEETEISNQKHRSYQKSDIFYILKYQRDNNLNNSQLSECFRLSRNTISKWKKLFI